MRPVKAIIVGVMVDVIGTTIIAGLIGLVLGFYLLSHGVSEEELEVVLIEKVMEAPWNMVGFALGAAISILAGYITAKIAKDRVYFYAGVVGCISGIFGYWMGLGYYSDPINAALSLLAIVSAIFGAFLWLKKNTPNRDRELLK